MSVALVQHMLALVNHQITPRVPSQGSVGYLSHMAHIGLALGDAARLLNQADVTGAMSFEALRGQLAQPAVLDNYVTSGLQEDHLSLGTGAALKLLRLLENVWQILAIEYLLAAQALDFHGEAALASGTRQALRRLRAMMANWQQDRWLAPDIAQAVEVLKNRDDFNAA